MLCWQVHISPLLLRWCFQGCLWSCQVGWGDAKYDTHEKEFRIRFCVLLRFMSVPLKKVLLFGSDRFRRNFFEPQPNPTFQMLPPVPLLKLKQSRPPQLNTISAPISSFFNPPPSSLPVYFSDICSHLPPFIIWHPVIMICLTKDSACLHFQKFINDPPHLAVNLIGLLFLRRVVAFPTAEATDLNKCLSIINVTLKPWKLEKAVIQSWAMLAAAAREAEAGCTGGHIHYWLVAEVLDIFWSSTLSLASAHSLHGGEGRAVAWIWMFSRGSREQDRSQLQFLSRLT